MRRRDLLRLLAAGAAGALAGCRRQERAPSVAPTSPTPPAAAVPHASPTPPVMAPPSPSPTDAPAASTRPLEILCREALGLAPPSPGGRPHTPRLLTLHHTAATLETVAQAPGRLRGHQRFHQEQGWPDISYHYGIDLAGNVYELRDPAIAGDTFTDYDPAGHFLVVCEGDFDRQSPTDALLDACAEVFAWAAAMRGIHVATLGGHRDHASTRCPGDTLYARLDDIRAAAAGHLRRGAPDAVLLCGEEGRARVAAIETGTR